MSVMPIHRTRSGLILALLGLGLSLAAGCQRTVPPAPSSGDFSRPLEEAEKAPATLDPALLLPASERSILMAGHVAAGLALAGAGQAEDAAAQLRAAVGKIDPGEVPGLEALGYDPAVFEAAASALEAGDIAQDKLDAVGANMKTLRANAARFASDFRKQPSQFPRGVRPLTLVRRRSNGWLAQNAETSRLLTLAAMYSAASSSALPPISPTMTMPLV